MKERTIPDGSRLHVRSIVCRAMDDMSRSVVLVTGVLFVYQDGVRNLRYLLPFVLLYFLAAALWESLYWYRFTYRVTDEDEISIRSGVLRRRHRTVPFGRIEHVRLLESPASRLFGVTGVHCETAGTRDKSEVKLRYVSPETASRLRKTLESSRLDRPHESRSDETRLYDLSARQLAAYSLLRIHYAPVIFAVGTVVSIAVLPFEATASLDALVVTSVRSALPAGFGLSKWGVLIVLAIIAGWVVGAARTAIRLYGFQLTRDDGTLYRRHGLLTRVEEEIPIDNVQIVRCSDNPLVRAFGQTELEIQTAGGSEIMPFDSKTTLVPLAPRADAEEIARLILPFDLDDAATIPKSARKRYVVRYLLVVVLALSATVFGRDYAAALASIPLAAYAIPMLMVPVAAHVRWSSISYTFGTDHLRICNGFWRRREYILPYRNVQRYTVSQTILQRRHDLSTLRIETAAFPLSIGASVPDMDTETAIGFGDRLRRHL
ncbi:PH domain-containing protein [Natrinema halophilum]|uniref:PH domain-containing protein n=1 Tax=Natrinema halophilum TaxID=1699371 RepID=A0A7D5KY11_9EURY|nr:PH domain-containing protein [Natrinema halophilum]QLG49862.1 PH domain-containing protein [Natrinema halophilum]